MTAKATLKTPSLLPTLGTLALSSLLALSSVAAEPTVAAPAPNPGPIRGKVFNPDISVNFLGLLRRGTGLSNDFTNPERNGLTFQEAEIQFFSDVDAYFRAIALFSIAQKDGSKDYGFDPEEVYLETISLPAVTLRAGKMKLALGKHNQLHTHAFPFIDAPLINTALLGEEGLNEVALSASALLPTGWFSEVTLQGFNPSNDALFAMEGGTTAGSTPKSGSVGGVAHWKNLFDLNDDTTLELGASGMTGSNAAARKSSVFGADLTFKWRPSEGGKYKAFTFATEYLSGQRTGRINTTSGDDFSRLSGLASWFQYQIGQRWWFQERFEFFGLAHSPGIEKKNKQSMLIGFFPSEFSGFRFQIDREKNSTTGKTDHTGTLQYNITIGAHPAHAY